MKYITTMTLITAAVATALAAPGHSFADDDDDDDDDVFVNNKDKDDSYERTITDFWEYAINMPFDVSPWFTNGEFCELNQSGKTFFLAGAFGGGSAYRTECMVPEGKRLFLPVLSRAEAAFTTDPEEQRTEEYLRGLASCADDAFAIVTIDGVEYDVSDFNYYGETRDIPVLPGSPFFGVPDDVLSPVVTNGVHVILKPLEEGPHTISWYAFSEDCGNFEVDVTYELEVYDDDDDDDDDDD